MTEIEFRPAAAKDLEEAAEWYEAKQSGLGQEFLEAVRATLNAIVENPKQFPVLYRNTRRALVRRFPYGVLLPSHVQSSTDCRVHARSEATNPLAVAPITYNKALQTDKVVRFLKSPPPRLQRTAKLLSFRREQQAPPNTRGNLDRSCQRQP